MILIRTAGPVSELRIQLEEMFLEVMFSTCSLNDRRDIHSLPHSLSVLQTIHNTLISSESSLVQQFYPQRIHHFTKSGTPWILRFFWNPQWPFQEPKLEVPTIYKAYIRPM